MTNQLTTRAFATWLASISLLMVGGCGSSDSTGSGGGGSGGNATHEPLHVVSAKATAGGSISVVFNAAIAEPLSVAATDFRLAEINVAGAYQGLQDCGDSDISATPVACRPTCVGYAVKACPEYQQCCTLDLADGAQVETPLEAFDKVANGSSAEEILLSSSNGFFFVDYRCLPATLHYRVGTSPLRTPDGRSLASFGSAKVVSGNIDVEFVLQTPERGFDVDAALIEVGCRATP